MYVVVLFRFINWIINLFIGSRLLMYELQNGYKVFCYAFSPGSYSLGHIATVVVLFEIEMIFTPLVS